MDASRYKSVAINMKTYKMLQQLAAKHFEMPISMSKTCEYFITKGFEKSNDGKRNK